MNGMAIAADWMSAASFISMAGLIAFVGYGNSAYLMGWTGGYVLLAMLLAPYLRKFGRFTVPEFIGGRYYSRTARLVAVASLLMISITYVRSEEHTSELQSLMRISYAVFCLKKNTTKQ